MAPLLTGFVPKSRRTILIRNCLRFAILHRFVPKSRRTILIRNPVYGAKSRHTILIGISAGGVMRIEMAAYYAGWHCKLQMIALFLGALLATAADPAPTRLRGHLGSKWSLSY